jgi:hypothetical protein
MDRFRPTLSAVAPRTWSSKESLTLLHPDGKANVIVSSEPVGPSVDLRQYAGGDRLLERGELEGYEELAFEPRLVFGGRSGLIRRFRWVPDNAGPVTQVQIYHVDGGRGYTATATTPTAGFAEFELELMDILDGLRIDDDTGHAAQHRLTDDHSPAVQLEHR